MRRRPFNQHITPPVLEAQRQIRLAAQRLLERHSLAAAAHLANCSENTLSRMVRGENVSVYTMARVADALGYETAVLVVRRGEPQHIALDS